MPRISPESSVAMNIHNQTDLSFYTSYLFCVLFCSISMVVTIIVLIIRQP
jgi:hypothetical protein